MKEKVPVGSLQVGWRIRLNVAPVFEGMLLTKDRVPDGWILAIIVGGGQVVTKFVQQYDDVSRVQDVPTGGSRYRRGELLVRREVEQDLTKMKGSRIR